MKTNRKAERERSGVEPKEKWPSEAGQGRTHGCCKADKRINTLLQSAGQPSEPNGGSRQPSDTRADTNCIEQTHKLPVFPLNDIFACLVHVCHQAIVSLRQGSWRIFRLKKMRIRRNQTKDGRGRRSWLYFRRSHGLLGLFYLKQRRGLE